MKILILKIPRVVVTLLLTSSKNRYLKKTIPVLRRIGKLSCNLKNIKRLNICCILLKRNNSLLSRWLLNCALLLLLWIQTSTLEWHLNDTFARHIRKHTSIGLNESIQKWQPLLISLRNLRYRTAIELIA